MTARRAAFTTTLLLVLAAGAARADGAGMAIELFTQGKQLMNAGDFAEARVRLIESARLDPKVGTLASLAVCEEKLGHLAEAHARWQQARALATATNDARRPLTESEIARIDRSVPKLSIEVRGGSPPGLTIKADDLDVGPGMLKAPLPVDPGDHTVSAVAPGKLPWSQKVHTEADGKVTVVVVGPLQDAPSAGPGEGAGGAGTGAGREGAAAGGGGGGWRGQRTTGVVVTGLGVAGLAVGGAFGVQTLVLKNQRGKFCDANNVCTSSGVNLDHDARTAATVSTIAMVAGGVVAAGGLVLVLTAPGHAAPVSVGAGFQPGGAQFTMEGEW
jgi:hypothetical protein